MDDYLDLPSAASYLGLPKAQLLRWAQQGTGPDHSGHPLRPDRMTYATSDLETWKANINLGGYTDTNARTPN